MKKLFKIALILSSFALVLSCQEDETTLRYITDNTVNGAWLRITNVNGSVLDVNDSNSTLTIELEYQDSEKAPLLDKVEFSIIFKDKNTGNGDSSATVKLGSLSKTDFQTSKWGLPIAEYSLKLGDALNLLGMKVGDMKGSDVLTLSWELFLTDGRTYKTEDANGNVSAVGAYYSSPYKYTPSFKCGLTNVDPLFIGDYVVTYDEWEDYGVGDVLSVVKDPTDPLTFMISNKNNPYITNSSTSFIKVKVLDANGNVSVSSNEDMCYDGWICVEITGSGKVNTCTGDISIDIDFGPSYKGYTLTLKKS